MTSESNVSDNLSIDFIVGDLSRVLPRRYRYSLAAAVTLFSLTLALGLRADYRGVFTVAYLAPVLVMGAMMATLAWMALATSQPRWLGGLAALGIALLGVSLWHLGLPEYGPYPDSATFWRETGLCFSKGLLTSSLVCALLCAAVFRWSSLPTQRQQVAIGLASGLAGVTMLYLHCPSPDLAHVAFGHWFQAVPLLIATILVQRWLIGRRLRRDLGALGERFF